MRDFIALPANFTTPGNAKVLLHVLCNRSALAGQERTAVTTLLPSARAARDVLQTRRELWPRLVIIAAVAVVPSALNISPKVHSKLLSLCRLHLCNRAAHSRIISQRRTAPPATAVARRGGGRRGSRSVVG